MTPLRLAFMGTPDYALPSLESIHQSPHTLCSIWTKPPSKTGRGMKMTPSPVALWAEQHSIACRQSPNLNNEEDLKIFRDLNLDAALVVSYGLILPKAFLETPKLGCLNLHPSLLPRWRGAAPIERALWAGDKKTGITIMLLGEGLDDGPILTQQTIEIDSANAGALRQRTSQEGAALLLETLSDYAQGKIKPQAQDNNKATSADKLTKQDEIIDWQQEASKILYQVRALAPKPCAFFRYKNETIKVLDAEIAEAPSAGAGAGTGEILDDKQALIACGQGGLKLLALQRQGKKPLPIAEFLLGFPLTKGERLN